MFSHLRLGGIVTNSVFSVNVMVLWSEKFNSWFTFQLSTDTASLALSVMSMIVFASPFSKVKRGQVRIFKYRVTYGVTLLPAAHNES